MLGWELPPHFAGGMGTVCYSLCEYLAKSGADIEFILPFEADYSAIDFMKVNPTYAEADTKITYEDLRKVNATSYGKVDITTEEAKRLDIMPFGDIHDNYMAKVAKVSVLGEFEVIHAHDWLTMRAGILAKQVSGLPLVVHVHATEFDRAGANDQEGGNPRIHDIEYRGMLMADKVIAVSEFTKNIIVNRYNIDPNKVEVVHNSIDLSTPHLHANSHDTDQYSGLKTLQKQGYKVVLNIGRHTIQKGLTQMLDAARIAIDLEPKLLFLFIGSGDQHLELINKAASLGISKNIFFTGFQSGVRVRDAFSMADVFVMPSVSEPFGTTPLEAMGFETPVIVSNQSGVSEIIAAAFKEDFWDVRAIADKIVGLARFPALANAMGRAGKQEVDRMTYSDCASKTLNTYKLAAGACV